MQEIDSNFLYYSVAAARFSRVFSGLIFPFCFDLRESNTLKSLSRPPISRVSTACSPTAFRRRCVLISSRVERPDVASVRLLPESPMIVTDMPIERLIPYARNPRNNTAAIDAVKASIAEFGFRQPIVVDEKMVVIVGHTCPQALAKGGLRGGPA